MIVITGATGKVGGATAAALAERGVECCAVARDPARASSLSGVSAVIAGDLDDEASLREAFAGARRVLVVPPVTPAVHDQGRRAIDAARAAGVEHVVLLSGMGASAGAPISLGDWHGRNEDTLRASGLDWTILRPNYFQQNYLGSADAVRAGQLHGATGDGRVSIVDVGDVGRVAAAALTEDGHAGQSYDITGPEALTHADMAAILADELGHDVAYVDAEPQAFGDMLASFGVPGWMAEAFAGFHGAFRAGYGAPVTDVVEQVGGAPATSFREFVQVNRAAFG